MISVENLDKFDFDSVPVDSFWNTGDSKELKVHRIHSYPAKFPAFITTKALEYAAGRNRHVESIADVFCGCGTTAFEAKRNNIAFWGCDINPVATMIATAKSRKYQTARLERYRDMITCDFAERNIKRQYGRASERLKYWYRISEYNNLAHLKTSIENVTPPNSAYRTFFVCAFSNILKAASVWLTKSIKPQVDPDKPRPDVLELFLRQCQFSISANLEIGELGDADSEIVNENFLGPVTPSISADLVITSPPYVTSYEYADLHQLSSLWLGYADDYRDLREGTIGSLHHDYNFTREWKRLNKTGNRVVSLVLDRHKSKARSIAKYFLDMQIAAKKTYSILSSNGLALFIIGNTEYKGVRIDNAKHLAESLLAAGFNSVDVTKRKISKKILTPYRDDRGKFSSDSSGRKVYSEEFILIGQK